MAGARLVIDDPENIENYRHSNKATVLSAGMLAGMPTTIVAADGSALPAGLSVVGVGNKLRFGFNRGTIITIH